MPLNKRTAGLLLLGAAAVTAVWLQAGGFGQRPVRLPPPWRQECQGPRAEAQARRRERKAWRAEVQAR
ncbi:hypothetical protein N6H14_12970 [Paenibacillus sp. CC-CFT747]|nr:hypothetical protein N6H14_12970 [Paenibacillus sp. CC-CFT747]